MTGGRKSEKWRERQSSKERGRGLRGGYEYFSCLKAITTRSRVIAPPSLKIDRVALWALAMDHIYKMIGYGLLFAATSSTAYMHTFMVHRVIKCARWKKM